MRRMPSLRWGDRWRVVVGAMLAPACVTPMGTDPAALDGAQIGAEGGNPACYEQVEDPASSPAKGVASAVDVLAQVPAELDGSLEVGNDTSALSVSLELRTDVVEYDSCNARYRIEVTAEVDVDGLRRTDERAALVGVEPSSLQLFTLVHADALPERPDGDALPALSGAFTSAVDANGDARWCCVSGGPDEQVGTWTLSAP